MGGFRGGDDAFENDDRDDSDDWEGFSPHERRQWRERNCNKRFMDRGEWGMSRADRWQRKKCIQRMQQGRPERNREVPDRFNQERERDSSPVQPQGGNIRSNRPQGGSRVPATGNGNVQQRLPPDSTDQDGGITEQHPSGTEQDGRLTTHQPGRTGQKNGLIQQQQQIQGQATGKAAAVGDAKVKGKGTASSINKATQEANAQGSSQGALSANTAQGEEAAVNGAAQSQGGFTGVLQSEQRGGNGRRHGGIQQQQAVQGRGSSAAVGSGGAKNGTVTSINQTNQKSSGQGTSQDALSANTASGSDANVSGAAQAGGSFDWNAVQQSFGRHRSVS